MKFRTCHDSNAVVACAKFYCDSIIRICGIANWYLGFVKFWVNCLAEIWTCWWLWTWLQLSRVRTVSMDCGSTKFLVQKSGYQRVKLMENLVQCHLPKCKKIIWSLWLCLTSKSGGLFDYIQVSRWHRMLTTKKTSKLLANWIQGWIPCTKGQ